MTKRLEALWILAWSLLAVLLGRLVRSQPGGARFREQFLPDRLQPIGLSARSVLMASSRCIGCGRCAAVVGLRHGLPKVGSPPELVVASARSMPEYDAAAAALGRFDRSELGACEVACPVGVPFVELTAVLRQHASLLVPARELGGAAATGSG